MAQLSHPYMTTGKTIALTIWTFVGKVMSLLFTMLSRLAIAFLLIFMCVCIYIFVCVCVLFFQILFCHRLLQDIEYRSLCYALGPCFIPILGKPNVLQSMGSQRVRHNLVTEKQ